jgi:hypothetical protein
MSKEPKEVKATAHGMLASAARQRGLGVIKPGLIEQIEALGVKTRKELLSNFDLSKKPLGEVVHVPAFSIVVDRTKEE